MYDIFPLIPFQLIKLERNLEHVFYAIKIMRIFKAFKYMKVSKMMTWIKEIYKSHILKNKGISNKYEDASQDEEYDEDELFRDYNKISLFLYIGFSFKTLRMFLVIVSLSYFSAMLFKMIMELE